MNKPRPLLRPLALTGFSIAATLLAASFLPLFPLVLLAALASAGSIAAGVLYYLDKLKSKILLVFLLSVLTALCFSVGGRFSQLHAAPFAGTEAEFSGEIRKIWRGDSVCYLVETESGPLPSGTPVLVYTGTEEYIPGDRVSGKVRLWDNPPSRSQLARGGELCGYAASENMKLLEEAGPVDRGFFQIRESLRTGFYRVFPKDIAEFFIALFTGDDSGLSAGMSRTFSALGISHILSVSGLHISMLTALVCWIFGRILGRGRVSFLLASLTAGTFVVFTGAESSAVRAYVMAIFSVSARFLCRDYSPSNSLGGAMTAICLVNPKAALSTGFWMSVLASAAIFSLAPKWEGALLEKLPEKLKNRLVRGILASLCITAAANLSCLPVYFLWMGSVSWKAFLPNLILTPLMPVLMIAGAISLLPGLEFLGKILTLGLEPLFRLFDKMAEGNSYLPLQFGWLAVWGIGSILLLGLAFWKGERKHRRLTVSLSVFLLSAGTFTCWISGRDVLSVSIVSAGSGQSIVLTQNGQSLVIGCGGSNQIGGKTASFLRSVGGDSVTALIIPEERDFLMGEAAAFSREIPPEQVLSGSESNWYQTLWDLGLAMKPLAAGEYALWEDGCLVISRNHAKPDIGVFLNGRSLLFQSKELPSPEGGWDRVFFYDEIYKKDGFSISGYAIIKAAQWRVPPEFLEGAPLFGEYFAAEERVFLPPRKE